MEELLKSLAPLGVGGALAAFIFWFNRQDAKEHADAWKGQSEMLLQVVKDNTAAVTSLQTTTAALNGIIMGLKQDMASREEWWRGHFPRT